MVLTARNRIPEKYTKANYLYHQGRIIAKVIKKVFEIRAIFEFTGIPCLDVMVLFSALIRTLRT